MHRLTSLANAAATTAAEVTEKEKAHRTAEETVQKLKGHEGPGVLIRAARDAEARASFELERAQKRDDDARAQVATAAEYKKPIEALDALETAAAQAAEGVAALLADFFEKQARPALASAVAKSEAARAAYAAVPHAARSALGFSPASFPWDGLAPGVPLTYFLRRALVVLEQRDFAASMTAPPPAGHNFTPNAGKALPEEFHAARTEHVLNNASRY